MVEVEGFLLQTRGVGVIDQESIIDLPELNQGIVQVVGFDYLVSLILEEVPEAGSHVIVLRGRKVHGDASLVPYQA